MRSRLWILLIALACGARSAAIASDESPPEATPNATADRRRIAANLSTIVASEYVAQGIVFEKKGAIVQPIGRLTLTPLDGLDLFVGFWSSFQSAHTDAGIIDPPGSPKRLRSFYEADWYAGATLTRGRHSLTSFYAEYYSPSAAFETASSVDVILTFADRGLLAETLAIDPYADLFFETHNKSGTGTDEGMYLQIGARPSLPFPIGGHEVLWTAPLSTGFGFEDFYAGDERWGYVSIGLAPIIPLAPWVSQRFGAWSFSPNVTYAHLNEDVQYIRADGDRVFATATITVDF